MKTLMILGGSGFFGKSFLDGFSRGLLNKWRISRIYIVSRNAAILKYSNPNLINDSIFLIDGDLAKLKQLPFADYVIHAAASSDAEKYLNSAEEEYKNIINGTENFVKIIKNLNPSVKILYISSGAVYGSIDTKMTPITEEYEFQKIDNIVENKKIYTKAKRYSEKKILELGKDGRNVAIARCFAFLGRYMPMDKHFAIGNFIRSAVAGKNITVKATNFVYRSYMYSDDLVHWLMTIVDAANPLCPIYNVGSDEALEILDIAMIVSSKYGVKVEIANHRSSNLDYYIPDISKAKIELGLDVTTKLSEALNCIINKKL